MSGYTGKDGRWWWGLCSGQLSGMSASTFAREQRMRWSRAHGSGLANKRYIMGISNNSLNQDTEKDKATFEQLETGSEQTRTVPIFCNWKNLLTGKTSIFMHKIFTCKVCCQACQVSVSSSNVWRIKVLITLEED